MKLVKLIKLPYFQEANGSLVIAESNNELIDFEIKRVFNVRASIGDVRGQHAHHRCSQLLICSFGSIEVKCSDSLSSEIYILDEPNIGMLIEPGIWAEQKYLENDSILTVICDRLYEESDYIQDYDEFIAYKK